LEETDQVESSRDAVFVCLIGWSFKPVGIKGCQAGGYQLLQPWAPSRNLPDTIPDESVTASPLVVDAIHKLNAETRVKATNYATSLSGHSVIIKKIQLPAMGAEELAESIQWEAEQYIPFDLNDVRLDYVVLSEGEAGRDNMEVLLVAVKRDKVNDYTSVISQTGKSPVLVDAFALQNAYEANYELDPLKTVALINMGAGVTNINTLARGATVFWRDISFGGNQFTEALQREFNLSFEQAEALKRGDQVDRYTLAEARPLLDAVSAEMSSEIHKTFDFFSATSAEGPVDQLMLSGGCALTPNLEQVLRDRFEVPVERMNPLRRLGLTRASMGNNQIRPFNHKSHRGHYTVDTCANQNWSRLQRSTATYGLRKPSCRSNGVQPPSNRRVTIATHKLKRHQVRRTRSRRIPQGSGPAFLTSQISPLLPTSRQLSGPPSARPTRLSQRTSATTRIHPLPRHGKNAVDKSLSPASHSRLSALGSGIELERLLYDGQKGR
jgi:type IV pilus assembly protein PilM